MGGRGYRARRECFLWLRRLLEIACDNHPRGLMATHGPDSFFSHLMQLDILIPTFAAGLNLAEIGLRVIT